VFATHRGVLLSSRHFALCLPVCSPSVFPSPAALVLDLNFDGFLCYCFASLSTDVLLLLLLLLLHYCCRLADDRLMPGKGRGFGGYGRGRPAGALTPTAEAATAAAARV
jgi:hypothetical protein